MMIPWLRRSFLARRRLDRLFLDVPDALVRRLRGRAHWPPYSLRAFVGAAKDFEAAGRFFVTDLDALGLLEPEARIFDWGCGCGRVALPLAAAGRKLEYRGVDVDRDCIDWCREHLDAAGFEFRHVNTRNASYNPEGAAELQEDETLLPFDAGAFDAMIATSVFTHLLPEDVERYLAEAARLLAPGGVLYASAFLFGDRAGELCGAIPFPIDRGHYALHREDYPENAIAYRERWFRDAAERAGLRLVGPVRRGVQDLMLWMKPVEFALGPGWHGLEEDSWRWTEPDFEVTLPRPAGKRAVLRFRFHIPELLAGALQIEAWAEGQPLTARVFKTAGDHVYTSAVPKFARRRERVEVKLKVRNLRGDATLADPRALGVQAAFHTRLGDSVAAYNRELQPLVLLPE